MHTLSYLNTHSIAQVMLSALFAVNEPAKEAQRQLDPEIFVEALLNSIASDDAAVVEVAKPMPRCVSVSSSTVPSI